MTTKKYLKLNDIEAYKLSFHLSNFIWDIAVSWEYFSKKTVGIQFVRAADSISANIVEGFGRYHKKDKIKFYRYAQGSIKEVYDWNEKSKKRKLINQTEYQYIVTTLQKIEPSLGRLIKFTNEKLNI